MTILVAEDFDDTRVMMRMLLEMRGRRVFEAADGRQAVEVASREHPDLVLMDLNMPVLDGISATRLLHKLPETAAVPVVLPMATSSTTRASLFTTGCSARSVTSNVPSLTLSMSAAVAGLSAGRRSTLTRSSRSLNSSRTGLSSLTTLSQCAQQRAAPAVFASEES
jgi:CheY-like chemotaxis protein